MRSHPHVLRSNLLFLLGWAALLGSGSGRANAQAVWTTDGVPFISLASSTTVAEAGTAPDGAGGIYCVWSDNRTGNKDLYITRLDSNGNRVTGWSTPGNYVCSAPGDQSVPRVTSDNAGGAYVIWEDSRPGAQGIYAQRILGNGQVASGWPVDGQVVAYGNGLRYAGLAADGTVGVLVGYCYTIDFPQPSVRVAKVSTAGSILFGPVVAASFDVQDPMSVAPDGSGGGIFVWNSSSGVRAQRVSSTGVVQWTSGPVSVGSGENTSEPSIASDGGSGVWVAYRGSMGGASGLDIRVTRLNSSGAQMAGFPMTACNAAGDQIQPKIIRDFHGNANVAWLDRRAGSDSSPDVYGTRVFADGTIPSGWTSSGVAVETGGSPVQPRLDLSIVPDGSDGIACTWMYAYDIFTRHLKADATLGSTVSTCVASGAQQGHSSVAAASGSVIAAWLDARSGVPNAGYAQRVTATPVRPAGITTVSIGNVGSNGLNVHWTVPNAHATLGAAAEFDLRYSLSPITDANVMSTTHVAYVPADVAGTPVCFPIAPLTRCRSYYFVVLTRYGYGVWTGISNTPIGSTLCSGNTITDCDGLLTAQPDETMVTTGAPEEVSFASPAPNPTRDGFDLRFGIPESKQGEVLRIEVYDLAGRLVRTLMNGAAHAGWQSVRWDGRATSGSIAGAGMYFVRISLGNQMIRRTATLVQ